MHIVGHRTLLVQSKTHFQLSSAAWATDPTIILSLSSPTGGNCPQCPPWLCHCVVLYVYMMSPHRLDTVRYDVYFANVGCSDTVKRIGHNASSLELSVTCVIHQPSWKNQLLVDSSHRRWCTTLPSSWRPCDKIFPLIYLHPVSISFSSRRCCWTVLTRSSTNAEKPREHTVSWNRVKCCTMFDLVCLKRPATCERHSRSFNVTAVAAIS